MMSHEVRLAVISHGYTIEKEISRGGQARVYLMKNFLTVRERLACARLLPGTDIDHARYEKAICDRLRAFGKRISKSSLDHILTIRKVFSVGEHVVQVTDYQPKRTLWDYLRDRGALPLNAVAHFASRVAKAIVYLHAIGVVHRDVKPANILFTSDRTFVKLGDLGLAAPQGGAGWPCGTIGFASPEQWRGYSPTLEQDVFSFGVTLYLALTGCFPFPAETMTELLDSTLNPHERASPVRELRPDLPLELRLLVDSSLSKNPRQRPSMLSLQHTLAGLCMVHVPASL